MIAIGRKIDIKLDTHVPVVELLARHIDAVESDAHELIAPAARSGQIRKLMLPQQDARKTIRVKARLTLVVGHLVKLAKRLAKGLPQSCRENPRPPALHLVGAVGKRVPQPNLFGAY